MAARAKRADEAFGGGRVTPQRTAIVDAVCCREGAFTAEELRDGLRAHLPGSGATATVYRAVAAMEESGFIERVGTRDGARLYARCSAGEHHHHVVCLGCGRIGHTECPLDMDVAGSLRSDGFVVTRHEMTLYGYCRACARTDGGR